MSAAWLLVLNAGSSSLKFAAFAAESLKRLASGTIEHLGQPGAEMNIKVPGRGSDRRPVASASPPDLVREVVDAMRQVVGGGEPQAIGHRVVHGGPRHFEPERVTPELLGDLRGLSPFDPEHLPAEIGFIEATQQLLPMVPQLAAFDTAFHRDLPLLAQRLTLPRRYGEAGVRRYGFHGLSYSYILGELERIDARAARGRVILAHLGSGSSMAAVLEGRCRDTSMAFTPAAGLMMGTRTGDLDPGLFNYIADTEHLTPAQFNHLVNHESGLLGVSGISADTRELAKRAPTDPPAAEALDLFCYQARKWIGSYAAVLGGLDTLVFAGGIGENSPALRAGICAGLEFLGVGLDPEANERNTPVISGPGSGVTVRIIPTDEEIVIARALAAAAPV